MLLAVLTITVAANGLRDLVFAHGEAKFIINLTGSEEVPPVQTNTTGTADIASDSISDAINVPSIQGATAGHMHLGKLGKNGPIVVTFFRYGSPMNEAKETSKITADMLEEQHPNGEIRGLIENP
jgi:hypothetical protein